LAGLLPTNPTCLVAGLAQLCSPGWLELVAAG